jgi:hypothetical protein
VDAADVVHLRHAPAQPQRPRAPAAAGEAEQRVEDDLLADQDRRGEVEQQQVGGRRQRATVVDPPVAVQSDDREVDECHQRDEPVVGHEARVLERAPNDRHDRRAGPAGVEDEGIAHLPSDARRASAIPGARAV